MKATDVKKQLDSILESNKESNLPKQINSFWKDIEEALNLTIDSWKGDDPADEVSKSWDVCNALLEKDSWDEKDIAAFKKEWRGSIVNALEFTQELMEDEPGSWKPIGKAWDKIDKLMGL
jgi:hypothetical protein